MNNFPPLPFPKRGNYLLYSYLSLVLFTFPMSTSYQLKSFEFGSGGDSTMNSTNYKLEGLTGEEASERQASTNYSANSGLQFVQIVNTPGSPTFTNDSNWYDKLKIIISNSSNPSDAKFAIAISTDNFSTTNYIQSDGTIGSNLGSEDFLTYTGWGGASGSVIYGLESSTTYYIKVKARHGIFTEGQFGPVVNASTVSPSITFDIDVSSTDSETAVPYSVDFGDLSIGSVTTATDKIWVDIETNAYSGGAVFIKSQNGSLSSATVSYNISSSTQDLSAAQTGYGAQGVTATQTSGGPLSITSPYNSSSENVGILDDTLRQVFSSSASIVGGRGSLYLKTKISSEVPSADDYTDTLTIISSAMF
jgi:hypothetical protein